MGPLNQSSFRGQSIHRLDGKGRLRIPAKFREVLQAHYTDALVVTMLEECLAAYPVAVWEKIEVKVRDLSLVQPHHRDFMRYFISGAEECACDNQGRILIPPVLRDRAGIEQEIVLAGMLTSLEIWDKAAWDRRMTWSKEHFREIAIDIAEIGL